MKNPAEQFVATNKANMEAFEGALGQAYAGMEKLVELNMAATKAALGESFGHAKAVMSVKTPQEFMTLQTGFYDLATLAPLGPPALLGPAPSTGGGP